jgi:hypothetical protein
MAERAERHAMAERMAATRIEIQARNAERMGERMAVERPWPPACAAWSAAFAASTGCWNAAGMKKMASASS